jgi:hypothetical protein
LLEGGLDTMGRDYLIGSLVEIVMKDVPPTVTDKMLGGGWKEWHWPCNGSSEEYAKAFYKAFFEACEKKGFKNLHGDGKRGLKKILGVDLSEDTRTNSSKKKPSKKGAK